VYLDVSVSEDSKVLDMKTIIDDDTALSEEAVVDQLTIRVQEIQDLGGIALMRRSEHNNLVRL
jgi:hypothetical protein